jgi:large subunit ribosomal protein L20
MPRVKGGVVTHRRHKRIMNRAKGFWGNRSHWIRKANEALLHAFQYAYRDRRNRKREFRRLWIVRINAAARIEGITYGRFMEGLKRAGIIVNRKIIADLAVRDSRAFGALVARAKESLPQA